MGAGWRGAAHAAFTRLPPRFPTCQRRGANRRENTMRKSHSFLFVGALLLASSVVSAAEPAKPAEGADKAKAGETTEKAPAQPTPPPQEWVIACQGDITKHCAAAAKAGDARPCLAEHEKDLTQTCKDAFIAKYRIVELCKDDIEKLCNNAAGRALGQCFNDNSDKLSKKCKGALVKATKKNAKEKAAATKKK